MKKIAIILLIIQFNICAQTLNQIISSDDEFNLGFTAPVLLSEKAVFSGKFDGIESVWALDLNNYEKHLIKSGQPLTPFGFSTLRVLNDHAYFYMNDGSTLALWRTDGTSQGTMFLVGEVDRLIGLYENNGILYTINVNDELIVTDGVDLKVFTVDGIDLRSMCFYDINRFVSYNDQTLITYDNGERNELSFRAYNQAFVQSVDAPRFLVSFQNSCYIIDEDSRNLNEISSNGEIEVTNINDSDIGQRMLSIHPQGDTLVTLQSRDSSQQLLRRWNSELSVMLANRDDFNFGEVIVTGITILNQLVAIKLNSPTVSPDIPRSGIIDYDLEFVPVFSDQTVITPGGKFQAQKTMNSEFFNLSNRDTNGVYTNELYFGLPDDFAKVLELPYANRNNVISNEGLSQAYVVSRDRFGEATFYEISSKPNVGSIMTGSWFNPDYESQGLRIYQGTRADGSEYLTLTGYTFRNGNQLWFAGNKDIEIPQASIEIELFEFSGTEVFEQNTSPVRSRFGSIKLEMISCNKMLSKLLANDREIEILLTRIDDVKQLSTCIE